MNFIQVALAEVLGERVLIIYFFTRSSVCPKWPDGNDMGQRA